MDEQPGAKITKWVFSLDQRAERWFDKCIKAGVLSARKHTSLQPVCIFDGNPESELMKWLKDNGVSVLPHEVEFKSELFSEKVMMANEGSPYNPSQASGAYLRIEAAKLISDPYFLYTDCDVMFAADPSQYFVFPKILGASPEVVVQGKLFGETNTFNSGVLIVNRAAFLEESEGLVQFCRRNNFYDKRHSSYDQSLLNRYFAGRWDRLVSYLNWRPSQGINADASIIHFHGPKPHRIGAILDGTASAAEVEHMKGLIDEHSQEYTYFVGEFERYFQ